ncbi:MAG: carboxyl-terminal processing protease, partial [Steroidobacteraceae bacterium]|nr:carboxyl-terminal processing protease [Steroidobacteraceae bacterium]
REVYQPADEGQSPTPGTGTPQDVPAAHRRRAVTRAGAAIAAAAVLAVGTLLLGTAKAPSASANATTADFAPTERHAKVARLVSSMFERSHYRQAPVNDPVSSLVLDRYLESIDGTRSFFLASDVAEFEKYRYELDDAVSTGRLEPAFAIFNRFQQRNRERMAHALKLLDAEPDFKVDETFEFDREHAPWAKTSAELDELWRKRVKNDALSLMLTDKTWAEARDVLRKRYERVAKRSEQITADDVFENFMNSFAHVFDPHSSYFSPRNSEEYRIQMSLSYEGIGASLQSIDDYVTIMEILPGGSAQENGELKAQDRILAVGQGKEGKMVDVVGWRLDDVVELIRGPNGSHVRLQIQPANAPPGTEERVVMLPRKKITLEAQAAKKEIRTIQRGDKPLKVGVITVPSFYQDYNARAAGDDEYRSTTRDVRRLLDEIRADGGVDGLVLDLRENGGGHLSEAIGLVNLFVPKGPVVQLRETGGRVEVLESEDRGVAYDGPLTILVDRFSASASEIFAAAMQDYGRGLVIGQETYGKGSVQNLYPLDRYALGQDPGYGQLTVTIGMYYRVTGDSTQNRGVMPDLALPSPISAEEVGESSRDGSLPWNRIRPADFRREGAYASLLPELQRAHDARVALDANFQFAIKEIAAIETMRSEKTVSLNLAKRKAERETRTHEQLTRENTRRSALGEPVLKSATEIKDPPDAILGEAAQIAADLSQLEPRFMARTSRNAPGG